MAKKRRRKGPSLSGYFKGVFEQHPEWVENKTNDQVLAQYRQDHNLPPDAAVEKRVKDAMANAKSFMRKLLRGGGKKKVGRKARAAAAAAAAAPLASMQQLEVQIDECMSLAWSIDRKGLEDVIRLLRKARNAVVWKLGEPDSKN